jgi:hypothetical protein
VLAGKQQHQLVLGPVRVLVLVHQDLGEPRLVPLQDLVGGAEQDHGLHQQVVEVHGVGTQKTALVLGVDVGDTPVEGIRTRRALLPELPGVEQLRLGLSDDRGDGPGSESPRVETELGDHQLDEAA